MLWSVRVTWGLERTLTQRLSPTVTTVRLYLFFCPWAAWQDPRAPRQIDSEINLYPVLWARQAYCVRGG